MSAGYTPATILCLPWKHWTVNSSRFTGPVDSLTADQRDQRRAQEMEGWRGLIIHLPLPARTKSGREY